jgi:hypothetical protein
MFADLHCVGYIGTVYITFAGVALMQFKEASCPSSPDRFCINFITKFVTRVIFKIYLILNVSIGSQSKQNF